MRYARILPAIIAACLLAACGHAARQGSARSTETTSGVKSTAYLPPAPNDAATGNSTTNTPNAVAAGQIPDWSNPTPPGLPAASAPLNGR
jgi:outer membrane PBP1 activator LpoA protein